MGIRSKKNRGLRVENTEIYNYYRTRIISAALAQFEWNNLPETCDQLYFERTLLFNGQASIYNLPMQEDTWLSTGFVQKSDFNVYGYPTRIAGVGYNKAEIPVDKFVVCYDNVLKEGLLPKIDLYARLLYEIHNTFRSNLRQQNTPYIVKSDRNTLMTIRNFFNNLFGFDPVIEVRQSTFDSNAIDVLDLRVDFKGMEMLDCLDRIWKEAMSMLGITEETSKKERMLTDEIKLNRMSDVVQLHNRMLPRIDFANRFNKLTGMDISVNLTSEKFDLVPYDEERSEDDEYTSTNNTSTGNTSTDNTERNNA